MSLGLIQSFSSKHLSLSVSQVGRQTDRQTVWETDRHKQVTKRVKWPFFNITFRTNIKKMNHSVIYNPQQEKTTQIVHMKCFKLIQPILWKKWHYEIFYHIILQILLYIHHAQLYACDSHFLFWLKHGLVRWYYAWSPNKAFLIYRLVKIPSAV